MRLPAEISRRDADLDFRQPAQLEEEPEDRACSALYLHDHFLDLEGGIHVFTA